MKNGIVENGERRLAEGRRIKRLKEAGAQHADELAKASFLSKLWLRLKTWGSSDQRRPGEHDPSPGTLW